MKFRNLSSITLRCHTKTPVKWKANIGYWCEEIGILLSKSHQWSFYIFVTFKNVFIDFIEEGEGEKYWCERETLIGCLQHAPYWGLDSTGARALTRNQSSDFLVQEQPSTNWAIQARAHLWNLKKIQIDSLPSPAPPIRDSNLIDWG